MRRLSYDNNAPQPLAKGARSSRPRASKLKRNMHAVISNAPPNPSRTVCAKASCSLQSSMLLLVWILTSDRPHENVSNDQC